MICLDCAQAYVLEFIGLPLCHQSYAVPFLVFLDQNVRPFLGDHPHSKFKLCSAISAKRTQHLTSETPANDFMMSGLPTGYQTAACEHFGCGKGNPYPEASSPSTKVYERNRISFASGMRLAMWSGVIPPRGLCGAMH
jgi:hypothetical protein